MTHPIRSTAIVAVLTALPAIAGAQAPQPTDLCDVGFAKVDANGDGAIQPREVSQAARNDYATMDADGNGVVTQAEFMACKNAAAGTEAAETDRTPQNMAAIDQNDDGVLTQQEFMQAGQDAYDRAARGEEGAAAEASRLMFAPVAIVQEPTRIGPGMYAMRNRVLFAALDIDRSGDISEEEWAQEPATRMDMRERLIDRFEDADVDQSGDLTEQEYTEARMKELERARQAAEDAPQPSDIASGTAQDGTTGSEGSEAGDEDMAGADASKADVPVVYYRYESVM